MTNLKLRQKTLINSMIVLVQGYYRYVNHAEKIATIGYVNRHMLIANKSNIRFNASSIPTMESNYRENFSNPNPPKPVTSSPQYVYKEMQRLMGLKVGDRVKVLRKARYNENGWSVGWDPTQMDKTIGRIFTIKEELSGCGGYKLDNLWNYPCFVLEKQTETPDQYYDRKLKELNVSIGDYVKVTQKADGYTKGWSYPWIHTMDRYIDTVCQILELTGWKGRCGIRIGNKNTKKDAWFPPFVLEKVAAPMSPEKVAELVVAKMSYVELIDIAHKSDLIKTLPITTLKECAVKHTLNDYETNKTQLLYDREEVS
jgi:hypothetical protein